MGEAAYPLLHYAASLSGLGATCVVRLNEADTYDAGEFVRAGLRLDPAIGSTIVTA
jgi:hypothetical protein